MLLVAVEDNHTGRYRVTYTAHVAGVYEVIGRINGATDTSFEVLGEIMVADPLQEIVE